MAKPKSVVAAALDECVHVAGVTDLARMPACLQLIEPLVGDDAFRIWRQTRVGRLSHPLDHEDRRLARVAISPETGRTLSEAERPPALADHLPS